jgi:GTP-binding protein
MYNWIVENGFYPAIIATKLDKLSRSQARASLARIRKTLQLGEETPVVAYSSVTKQGREEIWGLIEQYVLAAEDEEQET